MFGWFMKKRTVQGAKDAYEDSKAKLKTYTDSELFELRMGVADDLQLAHAHGIKELMFVL
jgi:hypothetical protein